ncbi:hypothetical protein TNCV_1485501 [Trichonephila clavipes]|nr:hypothetical protein TNCV_1485501 [Trichonephila clavipes]
MRSGDCDCHRTGPPYPVQWPRCTEGEGLCSGPSRQGSAAEALGDEGGGRKCPAPLFQRQGSASYPPDLWPPTPFEEEKATITARTCSSRLFGWENQKDSE